MTLVGQDLIRAFKAKRAAPGGAEKKECIESFDS